VLVRRYEVGFSAVGGCFAAAVVCPLVLSVAGRFSWRVAGDLVATQDRCVLLTGLTRWGVGVFCPYPLSARLKLSNPVC